MKPLHAAAASSIVIIHLLFLAFVLFGGLLLFRWPAVAWLHLPLVGWGVLVVLMQWECPLTRLENHWRRHAGKLPYPEGFIEHYITAPLFPEGLPRSAQIGLGLLLALVNLGAYGLWLVSP